MTEETKRLKAKNLRFKKPICRDLNLDAVKSNLYDIMCECEDIRWYTDSEDGEDTLINALAGDEDEAYEFKNMFILSQNKEKLYNLSGHIEGIGYEETKEYAKGKKEDKIRHTLLVYNGL